MTGAVSKEQIEEISSLLLNEQKCVSVGGIAQLLGISRYDAANTLREIVVDSKKNDSRRRYEITTCTVNTKFVDSVPTTVFQLVKKDSETCAMDTDESATSVLYAVALTTSTEDGSTEALSTAHERDMAHFRDQIKDHRLPTRIPNPGIAPSTQVVERILLENEQQQSRRLTNDDDEAETEELIVTTTKATALSRGPKTQTTAANFFGSVATKRAATSRKNGTLAIPSTTVEGKENKTKEYVATSSAKHDPEMVVAKPTDTKKKNDTNFGNADDFVGDMESDDDSDGDKMGASHLPDDDDDAIMMEIKPEKPKRKVVKTKSTGLNEDNSDDNDSLLVDEKLKKKQEKPIITGAMDAFATTTKKTIPDACHNNPEKKKRRRKKLVDKTAVDSHGYLHTETQEIWEDIPSDEEVEMLTKTAPLPQKQPVVSKPAQKSHMKQGNLMGFFKTK